MPRQGTAPPILGGIDRDGPALPERRMAWIYLVAAGTLEVVWAFAMKQSHGFTRPGPTLVMAVTMLGSLGLLSLSMRTLPLGTAYTIWTGIGAVGAFLVGIAYLGEAATPMRLAAAALIVAGLVLMKLSTDP
jgi:quaternary ammonium compound-resistance protein SugE